MAVGAIVVPLLLSLWSPLWFAIAWGISYVVVGSVFIVLVHGSFVSVDVVSTLEQRWSAALGAFFAAAVVSSVVFSDDSEYLWIAAVMATIYIAHDLSTAAFADFGEWRVGIGIAALAVAGCAFLRVHPLVALGYLPIVVNLVRGTSEIRARRELLETRLVLASSLLNTDELTGLLNRRGIRTGLEPIADEPVTVVIFDLDRFKTINDTYGYEAGDDVLRVVAQTIARRLPSEFQFGRHGGDEFVAFAPGHVEPSPEAFAPVACSIDTHGRAISLEVAVSAGIVHAEPGLPVDRLLARAGYALRSCKQTGKRSTTFDGELSERFARTIEVASLASRGWLGQLIAVGQPIVTESNLVGVELLVRWRREDGTVMAPDDFLPMARETGAMTTINEHMVTAAIRFAAELGNRPDGPYVAVNLNASYLMMASFELRLRWLLAHYQVDPGRIMIEITESEYVQANADWIAIVQRLRSMGLKLAVDDFGSGYSSIERIRHLPVSHLKFDRSLVQSTNPAFIRMLQGVVDYAAAMNIEIIAEGVETEADHARMSALGVGTYQGWLFSKAESLDTLLARALAEGGRRPMPSDPFEISIEAGA